ncbi:MAG: hypothetical protein ACR2J0_03820 [Mycobacteriales bacterium]
MSQEPVTAGAPTPTGEPRVDAALDRLAELGGVPPAERVRGYDEVHRRLADTLADPDEG